MKNSINFLFFWIAVLLSSLVFSQNIYIGHITGSSSDISTVGTATLYFSGDISIAADGIYENDASVEVKGDIVNANTGLAFGTGTLYLTGSASQTISGTPLKVYDVVFNNTDVGIILNTNMVISNTATFTDGIVTTGANTLIFNDGSSTPGGSDASHVSGTVEKIGNAAFTFPIGDGTKLRTAAISAPSLATDAFSAAYFYTTPTSGTLGAGLHHVSSLEKWNILRTVGSSTPTITLSYDPTYSVTGTVTDLRVASLIAGTWTDMGGSGAANVVPATTASSSFGEFTLGSSTNLNPLPVKLISFEAVYNQSKNGVDLNWATASELNSNYFDIERSEDGAHWDIIGDLKAAGNSAQINYYDFFDDLPFSKAVFYRLKQIDLDGKFEYSDIRAVLKLSISKDLQLYPNPVNSFTKLYSWCDQEESRILEVTNQMGQVVFREHIQMILGENCIPLNMENLAAGTYLIRLISPVSSTIQTIKLYKLYSN